MPDTGRSQGALTITIGLTAAVVGLLATIYAMHLIRGTSVLTLMRDPAASMGQPFHLGAISHLGILGWASAAAVCIVVGVAYRDRHPAPEQVRFLLSAGLLTAVLCLDDLYMVHEEVGPNYLGIREEIFLLTYVFAAAALVVRFRHTIVRTGLVLFATAAAAFATSMLADVAEAHLGGTRTERTLLEDGAKLLGIVLWAAYLIRLALHTMRGAVQGAPPAPRPHAFVGTSHVAPRTIAGGGPAKAPPPRDQRRVVVAPVTILLSFAPHEVPPPSRSEHAPVLESSLWNPAARRRPLSSRRSAGSSSRISTSSSLQCRWSQARLRCSPPSHWRVLRARAAREKTGMRT